MQRMKGFSQNTAWKSFIVYTPYVKLILVATHNDLRDELEVVCMYLSLEFAIAFFTANLKTRRLVHLNKLYNFKTKFWFYG